METPNLSLFQSDYNFAYAELFRDKAKFAQLGKMLSTVSKQAYMEIALVSHHIVKGVTLNVEKKVSDELMLTDLHDCHYEDMAWPANSVEFHFEDRNIGSMLIAFMDRKTYAKQAEETFGVEIAYEAAGDNNKHEYMMVAAAQNKKGETCCTLFTEMAWREVLKTQTVSVMKNMSIYDVAMDDEEARAHTALVLLCMKVLAYASVPRLKPVAVKPNELVRSRNDAKPGFKNRPARPAFRILYLPTVIKEGEREKKPHQGGTHAFHGRRGHIRHYRSDYFVNKKGTWEYMPPVVVSTELRAKYNVVKRG